MNFKTFSDLNRTIFTHLHELPKDIDIVAGIPGSGLLAANIIALYLNLPLTDIDSLAEGRMINISRTMFMAVYAAEEAVRLHDAHFEIVGTPRMFEWNYLHHSSLSRACFDIDGEKYI